MSPSRPPSLGDLHTIPLSHLAPVDSAGGVAELEAHLRHVCDAIGVEFFSYVLLLPQIGPEPPAHTPLLMTSYPAEYARLYREGGHHRSDSVVAKAMRARRPFLWGGPETSGRLSGTARERAAEGRAYGIHSGLSVPVHGPQGECSLFSVASARPAEELAAALSGHLPLLELLAPRVHAASVERLVGAAALPDVTLTTNERVCLDWTLRGKTAWEISRILGRSKSTVDYHVQTAGKKLGAANKVHAAFLAFRAGLL